METYQILIFGLLAWLTAGTLLNVLAFPTVRRDRPGEQAGQSALPLVSILVPARDEEANIGRCVRSLIAQDYPDFEVLVLDDHSGDGTAGIVRGLGFAADAAVSRFRLLAGDPLPDGWAGKPWACHQLARQARGEWLLFTDADTWHAPGALRAAVETALRTRAGLLSAWPRQIMGSWAERAIIPLLYILTHTLLPQLLVRILAGSPALARLLGRPALASLGAANGQFMLFRRDVYDRVGGHAAVAGHLVEDVALGRLVMANTAFGMRLVNADGSGIVRCRMYHGFREVWEGFSKNLRPVFGTNVLAFLASGVAQTGLFVMPFVFATLRMPGQAWALGQVGLILLIRLILAWRFRTGLATVAWHPVAYPLAMAIAVNSWRWSLNQAIRWKGRIYRA